MFIFVRFSPKYLKKSVFYWTTYFINLKLSSASRLFCTESSKIQFSISTRKPKAWNLKIALQGGSEENKEKWDGFVLACKSDEEETRAARAAAFPYSLLTVRRCFCSCDQWSQIWNRRSVSHSQPACRCESGRERRGGTLPFFIPRHSCMRERLVPFPLILLASSL